MGAACKEEDDAPPHPVDRVWAWVILSASLCAMIIYGGIHRGFGILFVEFRKKFDSSSAGMSIVVSVQIAVMSISGFGFAAVLGPSLIITGQYFDTRRGIANGLYTAAASFGALVLAPAFRYFVDALFLKGALLILAGLAFHIVPAGMLLRPPELYEKWACQKISQDKYDKENSRMLPLVKNSDTCNEDRSYRIRSSIHFEWFTSHLRLFFCYIASVFETKRCH